MMPYEISPSKLDSFIAEALRNEEIQDGAKRAELEEESLTSTLRGRTPEIWEAASSEIETYNQLENTLEARLAELRQAEAVTTRGFSTNGGLIVSMAVIAFFTAGLLLVTNQLAAAAVVLIVIAVLGALLLFLTSRSRRLFERDNNGTS